MLFVIHAIDRESDGSPRANNREAHLGFLAKAGNAVKLAGPLLSDDGSRMVGSLLVIEAGSLSEARAWAENDPYRKANVFQSVDIRPWKAAVGTTTIV
ncbi:MAG: YciI family protein [Rhodospirillales bacterium]|nr:YciI family protein [Rhodospirillales bacterium]